MSEKNANYFTAGELSTLFGISKQALFYYERNGLLQPSFINEKGYRYYEIDKYLLMEIIVGLRKLDLPTADIHEYLSNRSKENFNKLIAKKLQECDELIATTNKLKQELQLVVDGLNAKENHVLNQIMLSYHDLRLIKQRDIPDSCGGKKRIQMFAKHTQRTLRSKYLIKRKVGWVVDAKQFLLGKKLPSKAFFSNVSNVPAHRKAEFFQLPAGLYMKMYFQGTFQTNAPSIIKQFNNFIKKNKLQICSDVYVIPIENHWLSDNPANYINEVFIHVEYAD